MVQYRIIYGRDEAGSGITHHQSAWCCEFPGQFPPHMNLFLNHEFQVTNEGCATLKEIKLFLKRIQATFIIFFAGCFT